MQCKPRAGGRQGPQREATHIERLAILADIAAGRGSGVPVQPTVPEVVGSSHRDTGSVTSHIHAGYMNRYTVQSALE